MIYQYFNLIWYFTNTLTFHQWQISTNTAEDSVCPLGSVVTHSDQTYAASHTQGMSETGNEFKWGIISYAVHYSCINCKK